MNESENQLSSESSTNTREETIAANAEKCTSEIKDGLPIEKRRDYADLYGPNWACILSGMGDQ